MGGGRGEQGRRNDGRGLERDEVEIFLLYFTRHRTRPDRRGPLFFHFSFPNIYLHLTTRSLDTSSLLTSLLYVPPKPINDTPPPSPGNNNPPSFNPRF